MRTDQTVESQLAAMTAERDYYRSRCRGLVTRLVAWEEHPFRMWLNKWRNRT